MTKRPKPIVLTVLDGWGYRAETKGNAIALARKPTYDELLRKFPNTLIQTSGPSVGLPEGQMGNSEVGHMNIGAGRIVHMDITRIDLLIANKQLDQVPLFQQAMERGRQRQLHFLGLAERWRRALAYQSPVRAAGDGQERKSGEGVCPLLHGRARHAAEQRPRFCAPIAAENARTGRRRNRHDRGPLLRHGPRQSLGARPVGLSARWFTAKRKREATIRSRRCKPATNRASPTNSLSPW